MCIISTPYSSGLRLGNRVTLGGPRARLQGQLMIGDQGRNVSPIMLGVLFSWVTLIFVGFGINAPRNAMVAASFLICAA